MLKNFIKKIFSVPSTASKFVRSSGGEFLLKKTDFGLVRVDFAVIEKIANRAIQNVSGIQDSELTVEKFSTANPFRIRLTLTLAEGNSAPKISQAVDSEINSALKELLQLEFYVPVDVKVKQIAQAAVTKRRRVR